MQFGKWALVSVMMTMAPATALSAENVVVVYDASGSMWGQIDGVAKIEIARDVMADLVGNWSPGTHLGLVAYGHRTEGDCTDIETLIEPGPLDRDSFISTVNSIRPKGRTPITAAVRHAAETLSWRDTPATVILISDGEETCNADPCALASELARQGVKFTAHVIGFDLEDKAHASLACIAENTGGVFLPARDAAGLRDALAQVRQVVEEKVEVAEPLPDAEIALEVPAQVITGAKFKVSWTATIAEDDYVTIVPAGAEEGKYGNYTYVRDGSQGELTAPAEAGLYEVRYVLSDGGRTMATAPIEVVEGEVSVSAPATVTTGANFKVSWTGAIAGDDYVTIVPAGTEEGKYGNYTYVRDGSQGELTAPAEAGLYEVRYVLSEGGRTMASAPVEVVDAEVSVSAPERVTVGARFKVSWTGAVSPSDYVTIVPVGTEEGKYGNYVTVREEKEGEVTAPAEAGLYEVRYVLSEGNRTMARAPIEVEDAEIALTGPDVVRAGSKVRVGWSATINPNDYVTIVPAGTEEGKYAGYVTVREAKEGDIDAPEETGLYEIRYVLNEDGRTLGRRDLEVVDADAPLDEGAALSVRAEAGRGETITVSWTGGADSADQRIALARADQADFTWIEARRIESGSSLEMKMPDEAGTYEIRFLDISNRKVLGRAIVRVQ